MSGGKGVHWPLTITDTGTPHSGEEADKSLVSFSWAYRIQSTLPSLVAVTDGNQGGVLQALRKKGHCVTMRILSATATATQLPSLGHRGTWQMPDLRDSEDRYAEAPVTEAGPGTSQ